MSWRPHVRRRPVCELRDAAVDAWPSDREAREHPRGPGDRARHRAPRSQRRRSGEQPHDGLRRRGARRHDLEPQRPGNQAGRRRGDARAGCRTVGRLSRRSDDRVSRFLLPRCARGRSYCSLPRRRADPRAFVVPDESLLAGRGARRAGDGHDQDLRRPCGAGICGRVRARPAEGGRFSLPSLHWGYGDLLSSKKSRSTSGHSATR